MTGMAVASTAHHYGGAGSGVIEPHTSASATMLHELRQAVIDGMSFCKDTTQLEWLGFSWLAGGSRHQSHLDGEGNPYVFLSRVVREVEVESCSEDEDGNGNGNGDVAVVEGGGGKGREGGRRRGGEEQISLWAENDLNISEVQGVRMWDKEIWAGRL